MSDTIKHGFAAPGLVDSPIPSEIQPSHWRAEHVFAGGSADGDVLVWDGSQSDNVKFESNIIGGDYTRGSVTVAVAIFHDTYTAANFENTLRSYLSVYTPITYQKFLDWYNKGTPLPDRPLLVTLDDGYALQYTDYKPVLEEVNCPAVFFVVTDFIDKGNGSYFGKNPMTWAQLAALNASPLFSVQDHTFTHLDCSTSSAAAIAADLASSIALFEAHLGVAPSALAWPAGYYSAVALTAAETAGYDVAFRVGAGSVAADSPTVYVPITKGNGRYALNRGGILRVGARNLYENVIPDPVLYPAGDVWILATQAVLTNGIVRHYGNTGAARTSATHKIPVRLGDFYHLEFKRLVVYGGAGTCQLQILLSDYAEAALETIVIESYVATAGSFTKKNYDFRITNASAGWLEFALYTDASSGGTRLDVKEIAMYQVPGMDLIGGVRKLPTDV
jgi:peptidoglycan/xylan/chitin deacetylase (PgdA/CDA1 family)